MPSFQAILLIGAATLLLASAPVSAQNASPPADAKPPAAQAKPAPANDNAFPQAESEAAAKEAAAGEKSAADGPAPAQDSPDRETAPESSSRSRMKGVDLLGDRDPHAVNGAGGTVNDSQLAKRDIRIGQLYMGDGNYPGAYARFKEATEVGPGDAEAVFYLAEAARKTSHLDEAATNYRLYLNADPNGKHGKDVKKALAQLAGK